MKSQPRELTFFTDRDLAPNRNTDVVRILEAADLSVEVHDDHFTIPVDDDIWLELCGQRGWIALTKDTRITYQSRIAKEIIMRLNVPVFVLIGVWSHPRLAQNFVNTISGVGAALERHGNKGFIARVHMQSDDDRFRRGNAGQVKDWLTYQQWKSSHRR